MNVVKRDGSTEPFDMAKIERLTEYVTKGLDVDVNKLKRQTKLLIYDGMRTQEIFSAQVSAAAGLISQEEPDFDFVAARYLLCDLIKDVTGGTEYRPISVALKVLVEDGRLSPKLTDGRFDLDKINDAIDADRDLQFKYQGLKNVQDRYLMRTLDGKVQELPQHFFMRVAMGLALNEDQPTERAIEFYNVLSLFDFMASTPTLFNSGTPRSQLSSCYLNTVADQISADPEEIDEHRFASIYGTIEESARLSKYAGGVGTDWNRVRNAGSQIIGTNGKSSGVVPYIKVWNDTAVAVNQGGKRKGSFAPYLEPWHPDFWDFCELKKEFGDERLRAHDVFPASWLPDLFMERVEADGVWSEFEPHKHPELHELFGDDFKVRYEQLEAEGKFFRQRRAVDVWKHILSNLFETGHPWITFKDECNRRNPQDHCGVVHSSNLCTEITLNTNDWETAVCNLGSVNISNHLAVDETTKEVYIDTAKLAMTIAIAMRMLDNVIDLNYYPSSRAESSNLMHRPVGLGVMGYTEAMVACGIDWESTEHLDWADELFELISFNAIWQSTVLAEERGRYASYDNSKWDRGILPIDTARDQDCMLDWSMLRARIKTHGMRNSNTMAIAPTATISLIVGTTPCIEPIFQVETVESNISGTFKVIDPCVKYGRPDLLKDVWTVDPIWVIEAAAVRQKWIDQSQSVNVFAKNGTKGRELDAVYKRAWKRGVKTTYYLRNQSSEVKDSKVKQAAKQEQGDPMTKEINLCSIDNPGCESCQ